MLTFWAFSFYYVGFHEIPTNNVSILLYVWTVSFQNIFSRFFLIYSIRLCFLSFLGKHPLHHVICLQRSHFYLLTWTLASFMHILRIQLWQCNSMLCHFCFINVLQFLSASTPSFFKSCYHLLLDIFQILVFPAAVKSFDGMAGLKSLSGNVKFLKSFLIFW